MTLMTDRPAHGSEPRPGPSTATTRAWGAFPVLTRVGGLPAEALDLVSDETREALAELTRLQTSSDAAGDRVVDGLFGIVPLLDHDVALRRRVLAGKRAVHKSRPLPWTQEETDQVTALLDPDSAAAVLTYREDTARRDTINATLESLATADRERTLDRLHEAVTTPGLLEALVMAAPDWVRHAKPHQRRATSLKDVKTLLSYVARAAAKTSPFSGLTTVGVAGSQGRGRGVSRTSTELGRQALDLLAREEATAGLFRYQAPVLRRGGPDEPAGLFLSSELVSADGIVWREDRVVEADNVAPWARLLEDDGAAGLDEVLARLGGPDPFARFRRLLDTGVLRAQPPWRRDEDPLAVLARLVADRNGPVSGADLHLLSHGGHRSARLSAGERLDVAAQMGRAAAALAPERGSAHRPSGLVYEDRECGLELTDPTADPAVTADLDRLARRIRPWVFRSHVYDLVVDRFVAEFGAGGRTRDPLGFLMRMSVERDNDLALREAQSADHRARRDPGERPWLPVGATSAPPNVGAMFQVAGPTADDGLPPGRPRVVVNNYGSGSGALFARFAGLLGDDFEQQLRRGTSALWRGLPTRELTLWTDCNTAQAQCSGVLPPLLVPGEPDAPDGLRIQDTSLVHDPRTGTLSLLDGSGQPFGLAYLGLTPRHLLQGYQRLLGTLADPWINASPDSDYTLTKLDRIMPLCGEDVAVLPRVSEETLVTRRASWILPRQLFPGAERGQSEGELLGAAERFRAEHGIPEEVFVHQVGGMGAPMSGQRKPMWASLASPTALRVLHQALSQETTHLRVVEAMPTREQHTQRDTRGRPVVTEHCALMHWDATAEEER